MDLWFWLYKISMVNGIKVSRLQVYRLWKKEKRKRKKVINKRRKDRIYLVLVRFFLGVYFITFPFNYIMGLRQLWRRYIMCSHGGQGMTSPSSLWLVRNRICTCCHNFRAKTLYSFEPCCKQKVRSLHLRPWLMTTTWPLLNWSSIRDVKMVLNNNTTMARP